MLSLHANGITRSNMHECADRRMKGIVATVTNYDGVRVITTASILLRLLRRALKASVTGLSSSRGSGAELPTIPAKEAMRNLSIETKMKGGALADHMMRVNTVTRCGEVNAL